MKSDQTLVLKHRGKFPQDTKEGTVGGAQQNWVTKAKVSVR